MSSMLGGRLRRVLAAMLLVLVYARGVEAASAYTQVIYRSDAFSTQATGYYCTAAVVQNIMNLAHGLSRHDSAQQAELYALGRANNWIPYEQAGVDPMGVEAMLEAQIPGSDWIQVKKSNIKKALRQAAKGMRATGLPAVLFVGGGKHVWTMNGYTATTDPARGVKFWVTSVRFSGPKHPRPITYNWYDLAPNTGKSVEKISQVFFPYKQRLAFDGDRGWTPWSNYYVAVVPKSYTPPDPDPDPTPTPTETPTPEATEPPAESPSPAP